MKRPIKILTERCALLELRAEDSPLWYRFMNDPRVGKYLPDRISSVEEMSGILDWLCSNYARENGAVDRLTLSVNLRDRSCGPLGWVTYGPLPGNETLREIGYALDPAWWGQGFATEAARGLIGYVRDWISKGPLFAMVHRDNAASIRVLEKIGTKRIAPGSRGGIDPLPNHDVYELGRDSGTLTP